MLAAYGGWEGRTRRDHRALVLDRLGWRLSAAGDRKQLDGFLLARALEHDVPGVLLQLACDWLRSEQVFRPSVDTLSRRVAAARDGARTETYYRLAPLLTSPRPARLDRLLDVVAGEAELVRETVGRSDRAARQVIWYPAQPRQCTQPNCCT